MVCFCVLCSKNILTKLVGYQYQHPTCLCVKMEFVVGTISLSCELFLLSKAAFVHAGPTQLCTDNGVSYLHVQCCGGCMVSTEFSSSSTRI